MKDIDDWIKKVASHIGEGTEFRDTEPEIPNMTGGVHPVLTHASQRLSVNISQEKGRHILVCFLSDFISFISL